MQTHSVLSEYNPIKRLTLPGVELPDPSGIVVIVGPNSSGKTLFLRDIERFLLMGQTDFVVCDSLAANKPRDVGAFVAELIDRRYIQAQHNMPGVYQSSIPFMGSVLSVRPNQVRTGFNLDNLKVNAETWSL
jgi:ABC-type cobalamin/Fe3+-siderophores transport system ATPase subunit